MLILEVQLSYTGFLLGVFLFGVGGACIWASYRLPVERVYNMRLSGVALTLIGLYLLFASFELSPAIPES